MGGLIEGVPGCWPLFGWFLLFVVAYAMRQGGGR